MSQRLAHHAPAVAAAFDAVSAARQALDIDILDPAVELFADQFGVDVTMIDDDLRGRYLAATGPTAFEVAQAIWVDDYWPRVGIAIGEVLGGDTFLATEIGEPQELWPLVEDFMREVARLDALDPVLTELIRLRGARQHACRLCRSRRSVAALEAGADESTFDAVDHYADSDLPAATKAALALTDAVIWSPYLIPPEVAQAASTYLTDDQVIEVVLDVTRNSANKIAVALGADAAAVEDGVELFTTDDDGNLTIVGVERR
jgi:alkylhydroperoxidase family enzyme